jgi:hypothetical protein
MLAIGFFHWGSAIAERGFAAAQSRGAREVLRDVVLYLPFLLVSSAAILAAAATEAVFEPEHTWRSSGWASSTTAARSAPPPPFGDQVAGSAAVADVSGLDTGG